MGTGSAGNKVGTATINSDALDSPALVINLSGTVLRHSSPSLDSAAVATSGTIDFGSHTAGSFSHQGARVHNQAYDALQARLSVTSGVITGGAGRFSIAGGFSSALLSGVGKTYDLVFDDSGATLDSTYDATLTISSNDEALPGATARPGLTVALHARVLSGSTGTGDAGAPAFTRLYAPFPNPLAGTSTARFDLSRAGLARLEVFDLSGRRVAMLANREFAPGRYSSTWQGLDDGGTPVEAGLYFLRLSVPGMSAQTARLAVLR
jgi:hypothetical protein